MPHASSGESRLVSSNQTGLHKNLIDVVSKHASSSYRRPIADHTQIAFETMLKTLDPSWHSVIVDSGCGTGQSSLALARAHPNQLIIAIDKSEARLRKFEGPVPRNLRLVHAELIDIWQLLQSHKFPIIRHYLFYPNPWPKAKHLKKRWHGNPIFPTLLRLSPHLTLRTNWRIYAMEFVAAAMHLNELGVVNGTASWENIKIDEPISAFEKKYLASGHTLFEVTFVAQE